MPTQIIDDSVWKVELKQAEKYYEKWEGLFRCKMLEDYYEGRQWAGQDNPHEYYSINKIYETIEIKLDQFIPNFPVFNISPKASNSDFNPEDAMLSAQLKQDVLNNFVSNEELEFSSELGLSYRDSFFRFAVFEVGYDADWIINPNAPRAPLTTDKDKENNTTKKAKRIKKFEPKEIPQNERVYFKHIPAKHFRIGGYDSQYLHRCGWYGYYEFLSKDDILATPGLMNRKDLELATPNSYTNLIDSHEDDTKNVKGDYFKVWHLWHNKFKLRLVVIDDPTITIFQRAFKHPTIFDYRPIKRIKTTSFYPIPPVFHWISPQNEINETREMMRAHRRRFVRKFQVTGEIDDEELQKFEHGPDGSLIKVQQKDAITAIQDAPLGVSSDKALITSADDLNLITGTSSAVRGKADRTTATEANIINIKADIRENAEKDRLAKFLNKIGRATLIVVRENFVLGVWVELSSDPNEQLFATYQENKSTYDWVSADLLNDGYDFRINVDVTTLSADTREVEKKNFLEFITIIQQYPQISLSPTLIRETAYRCNYRNEKVIRELQQMALLQQVGLQAQVPGLEIPGLAQQVSGKFGPPTVEESRNQIGNQLLT